MERGEDNTIVPEEGLKNVSRRSVVKNSVFDPIKLNKGQPDRSRAYFDNLEDDPKWKKIGTRAAEIKGYKVRNPFEVSIYPNNLPLKGFSPNNKNLPKDVK